MAMKMAMHVADVTTFKGIAMDGNVGEHQIVPNHRSSDVVKVRQVVLEPEYVVIALHQYLSPIEPRQ